MIDIIQKESQVPLSDFVRKLIPESIGGEIEKATQGIYPLQNVFIRKVKTLKSPKVDMAKLLEAHSGLDEVVDAGVQVDRPDDNSFAPQEEEE